jgi:hypothetical protein
VSYPMSWGRVVNRNKVRTTEPYNHALPWASDGRRLSDLIGDLRRLEEDAQDAHHLDRYAAHAGITPEQAGAVMDAFFRGLPGSVGRSNAERGDR